MLLRSLHRHRWSIATALAVTALITPVALDRDSFPLSTYPMYAQARSARVALPTAVGIDADGGTSRLSLGLIGDSDDPLVVAGELRAAIARDAADRCDEIARRVDAAGATDPAGRRIVAVEVVVEQHDVVDQAVADPPPVQREVHARCEVGGAR